MKLWKPVAWVVGVATLAILVFFILYDVSKLKNEVYDTVSAFDGSYKVSRLNAIETDIRHLQWALSSTAADSITLEPDTTGGTSTMDHIGYGCIGWGDAPDSVSGWLMKSPDREAHIAGYICGWMKHTGGEAE